VLEPINESQVRGIQMVKDLANACIGNQVSTASLLERYRDESFFTTLSQLANHQHHNMESLSDEEAVSLIKANNTKIFEAYKEVKLTAATNELASLNTKQKVTELNAEEAERKNVLSLFIRDSYR
jgi:16S rRNA C1402 (ribose-2'-O) methylase RsmI